MRFLNRLFPFRQMGAATLEVHKANPPPRCSGRMTPFTKGDPDKNGDRVWRASCPLCGSSWTFWIPDDVLAQRFADQILDFGHDVEGEILDH